MYPDLLPLSSSSSSLAVGSVVAEDVSVSFVEGVEFSASMSFTEVSVSDEVMLALAVIVELSILIL